jgi:hypothetical protein
MPRSSPIAALLAVLASLALAAPAMARHHTSGDARPGLAGSQVVAAGLRLGPAPDRHLDVSAIRGIEAKVSSTRNRSSSSGSTSSSSFARARTAAATVTGDQAATPAGKALDLRVLLLSADGNEPTYHWWRDALTKEGVPFDTIVAATAPDLTAEQLRAGVDHGRYEAIVLASGGLAYSPDGGFTWASALSSAEWATLQAYELAFGVREVDAYAYPQPAFGLQAGAAGGDMSGTQAQLAAGGDAVFSDLVGPVPVDQWSWGYQGTPIAGSSWKTLVSGPGGAIVGTYTRDDGTEAMVNTVDTNEWSIHGHALFQGMLEWVTRGVHLGISRNYFGMDVDDLFLPDDRWNPIGHVTPEDGSSTVRMVPSDVTRAVEWEHRTGISLNMLFNGDGSTPTDPLTQAVLAAKNEFRWTSHTFSHPDLDPASLTEIKDELQKNIDFAHANGIPIDPSELVTGGHSGLANPAMPAALDAIGVKWIGADASRQPNQYAIGGALTVPRHPTGIYYNVGTRAEELDEYNWINFTACPTGNLGCLSAPADWSTYVGNEASMILRHILDNDPRPHYVHQSNLAEDGTMYPVVDEVLARYHRLFKAELVQPGERQAGEELARMNRWQAAIAAGTVSGTITADGQVVVHSDGSVAVPVTGGSVGSSYGGVTSGWTTPAGGDTIVGGVPGVVTPPSTDPPSTVPPSSDPGTTPPADDPSTTPPTTEPPPADVPAPAGSYGSVIAGDHATSYWHLNSVTDIHDATGGHDGAWRNGPPTQVPGIDGAAAGFDGGALYGEINGITAPTHAYTLEAWVIPADDGDMALVEHGGAGALAIVGGHVVFRHVGTDLATTWDVTPGHWYHVVGTWDGTTARLYVDGNLSAKTATSAVPSGASTFYLGRGDIAPNLNGRLDAVAYYDVALTRTQIAQHTSAAHAFELALDTNDADADPNPPATPSTPAPATVDDPGDDPAQDGATPSVGDDAPAPVTTASKPKPTKPKAKKKPKKKKKAKARAKTRTKTRHAAAGRRA